MLSFVKIIGSISSLLPQPVKLSLYRMPFANFLRRQLNRLVPNKLTMVSVAGGPIKGMKLCLNLKEEKYYWLGTYEPQLVAAIHDLCHSGMTVYDIGADIGYVSLVFAQVVGKSGRVFAFEPFPANAKRLQDHVTLNGLDEIVTVKQFAIADKRGKAHFLVHSSHAMGRLEGSIGRRIEYLGQIQVETIGIDEFCYKGGNPVPDLIKMDIEGGGVFAVQGMKNLVAKVHPIMLVELHGPEEGQAIWNLLAHNGYKMYRVNDERTRIADVSELQWKEYLLGIPSGRG